MGRQSAIQPLTEAIARVIERAVAEDAAHFARLRDRPGLRVRRKQVNLRKPLVALGATTHAATWPKPTSVYDPS